MWDQERFFLPPKIEEEEEHLFGFFFLFHFLPFSSSSSSCVVAVVAIFTFFSLLPTFSASAERDNIYLLPPFPTTIFFWGEKKIEVGKYRRG